MLGQNLVNLIVEKRVNLNAFHYLVKPREKFLFLILKEIGDGAQCFE